MTGDERRPIVPGMKVSDLLGTYPELEEVLIDVAPAFKKLRNPILRRTVARVTTLAQAARVGGVSVTDLVARLRREVGQPETVDVGDTESAEAGSPCEAPSWLDRDRVVHTLDARPLIEAGQQPIGRVLRDLDELDAGAIYLLVTPFEPAPLIDQARSRGFLAWSETVGSEFHTYFQRS